MIFLILVLISLLVILPLVGVSLAILYHFKRFGIEEDPNTKKFLNIFKIGLAILIGLNIILLIFVFIK